MAENELMQTERFEEIDAVVKKYSFDVVEANAGAFSKAIILAKGIQELRKAFDTEVLQYFMALQGTAIGFKTDKKYSAEIVRDCAIEALLRGAYPVGNEFNIIAERAYFTKEYFERKLREYPGFSNFVYLPGIPKMVSEKGAIVHCKATWILDGNEMESEEDIPVRVNAGQGPDAILGKAKRKFCARVYARISGSVHWVSEGEVDDARETDADIVNSEEPQSQTDKLKSEMKARNVAPASTTQREVPDDTSDTDHDPEIVTLADLTRKFKKAHAKLSSCYEKQAKRIDDLLFGNGIEMPLFEIHNTELDPRIQKVIIAIAEEI